MKLNANNQLNHIAIKFNYILFTFLIVTAFNTNAQVGVGTNSPDTSSMLDVQSTTKGFLAPRMTTTERDAIIDPTIGLQIYNITTKTIDSYNGSTWVEGAFLPLAGGAMTGSLVLAKGTTVANTAPIKFTMQAASLTTVEPGTMEYVGHSLQFSQFLKRRGIAMSEDVRITSTTLTNTTTESGVLATVQHGANYLEVGKSEETVLRGRIRQDNASGAKLTIKVYYDGVIIHTMNTDVLNRITADSPFVLTIVATCRSIGGTGTMQINSFFDVAGEKPVGGSSLATINTTIAQDTTITAQWSQSDSNNIFIVEQARTLCIEPNK